MSFIRSLIAPTAKIVKSGEVEISGIQLTNLRLYFNVKYNTSRISNYMFRPTTSGYKFYIKQFFLLEFAFMLQELIKPTMCSKSSSRHMSRAIYTGSKVRLSQLLKDLRKNTWLKNFDTLAPKTINPKLDSMINYTFKDYQEEFVKDVYLNKKHQCNLHGYLLAFSPGMGKTMTGLSLMAGINKEKVIVTCPKSTIDNAWVSEINALFKEPKKVWASNTKAPLTSDYDYYVVNYESMSKLEPIFNELNKFDVGIIVDESHNFKDINSSRTKYLVKLKESLKCEDVLLMSGTPISAMGLDMIPILRLLDPLFTPDVEVDFKKIFGTSTNVARELLNHRLGNFMFRKLKEEALNLPQKTISDRYITIPNGQEYTLSAVKEKIVSYAQERSEYYTKNFKKYQEMYNTAIAEFEKTLTSSEVAGFKQYQTKVKRIKRIGAYSPEAKELIPEINIYEKTYILPRLQGQTKKDFVRSKSVVKYVDLKIMGEVLGGLLNRLRSEMFQQMIEHSDLLKIIERSEKKTICFTTYVDVAAVAMKYLENNKLTPVLVDGSTSKDVTNILTKFKENDKLNPLVATIQTLATGVTILSANTVVFLNVPWRQIILEQAMDRVHRIGQDTPVYVFKFILDTGEEDNLSTRMESILAWSKEAFDMIVENTNIKELATHGLVSPKRQALTTEEKKVLFEMKQLFKLFDEFGIA